MKTNILIVDDETEIADLIGVYLRNEDYNTFTAYNAKSALKYTMEETVDLAVLDIMLPDMDGFSLCQKIRENHNFPIIMLTAKVEDMDKINGLSVGADDYITKPFNPLELVARIKAQLRRYRRYNETNDTDKIDFRGLIISKSNHTCNLYGKEIVLTPTEFNILWMLCENRGRVVSSEDLFEQIWGEKYLESNNTVMVHIRRLREKMNEPKGKPKWIKTIWGVGYKIEK